MSTLASFNKREGCPLLDDCCSNSVSGTWSGLEVTWPTPHYQMATTKTTTTTNTITCKHYTFSTCACECEQSAPPRTLYIMLSTWQAHDADPLYLSTPYHC